MPGDIFYTSKEWVALRDKVRKKWRAAGKPCGLCGKPFLKGERNVVDHIIERRKRPDLSLTESNLHVTHHACNSRKAKAERKPAIDANGFPPGWQ